MRRLLLSMFLTLAFLNAWAAESLTRFNVVLLQPDQVLQERVVSVELFAAYIGAVEEAARSAVTGSQQQSKASGFIVVAVRPGQRSNVWLDFEPNLPSDLKERVAARVRTVQPPIARVGAVVFAIKVGIGGAAELSRTFPSPTEWKAAAQKAGRTLETGELVELIWNE